MRTLNHELDQLKLDQFKGIVLPMARKLIESELEFLDMTATVSDLKEARKTLSSNLDSAKVFPELVKQYADESDGLETDLESMFKDIQDKLSTDIANCEEILKPHQAKYEYLQETVKYQKDILLSILNVLLKDCRGFLEPDDIHKNREYKKEILYIICVCPSDKIVFNLLSLKACNKLSEELRPLYSDPKDEIEIVDSIKDPERKLMEFYMRLYDVDPKVFIKCNL